jgi:hypothetical protein
MHRFSALGDMQCPILARSGTARRLMGFVNELGPSILDGPFGGGSCVLGEALRAARDAVLEN